MFWIGGKCCIGEKGYVWVNLDESEQIVNFLDISLEQFKLDYLRKVNYKWSIKDIKVNDSYECVFFDNGKCTIYEVRPLQCRTFPFWDQFEYKDKSQLDYLKQECPGVIFNPNC